jgi:D-alanyl-D-alanine carboxypeptidase
MSGLEDVPSSETLRAALVGSARPDYGDGVSGDQTAWFVIVAMLAALLQGCAAADSESDGTRMRTGSTSSAAASEARAQAQTAPSAGLEQSTGEVREPPTSDQIPTASSSPVVSTDSAMSARREDLQHWLDGWRQTVGVIGAVAGVKVGEEPPIVVASGLAGRDGTAPIDPAAPFFVASITKTFVAAAIMQLVDEGRVGLDDAASQYVDLWPDANAITLRQLLGHTSGLPGLANSATQETWAPLLLADPTRVWTPQEALAVISDDGLMFEPGTGYNYSSANFIVAGLVIEAVTGSRLQQVLKERFLAPLHLNDTYLDPTRPLDPRIPDGLHSDPATGQDFEMRGQPLTAFLSVLGASAGMVSTPADLLEWVRAVYGGGLLSSSSLHDMAGQHLGTESMCPCGSDGGPSGVGHGGLFPGFESVAVYSPGDDMSIVL